MNETCQHAHEVISMAYDGEHVTAQDLRDAKAHCTTCPECAAFVSGLARVRQTPGPKASEAVIDRAMVAVKREAQVQAAAAAKARRDAVDAAATPTGAPAARPEHSWVTWGGWAAAASAIILAVGVITVNGVRYMNSPSGGTASTRSYAPQASESLEAVPNGDASGVAANRTATTSAEAAKDALSRGDTPAYVVYQSLVYVVSDTSEPIPANALRLGTLTSNLGTGSVVERAVYAGEEPGTIFVAEDDRSGYLARVVVRKLDGQDYALTSAAFTEYGVWPQLPLGMSQPTSSDGSSTFEKAGRDDLGVEIFVLPNTDTSAGFAVGPGTGGSDPATGNPNWTWWSPLK